MKYRPARLAAMKSGQLGVARRKDLSEEAVVSRSTDGHDVLDRRGSRDSNPAATQAWAVVRTTRDISLSSSGGPHCLAASWSKPRRLGTRLPAGGPTVAFRRLYPDFEEPELSWRHADRMLPLPLVA